MKLFVQYESYCVGGESAHEEFGDWWSEHEFRVKSVATAPLNRGAYSRYSTWDEEFEVDFDAMPGETLWVLSMIYSSGDSFGRSDGNGEVLWVFKDRALAEAAARQFEEDEDSYNISIPTDGGKTIQMSNPAYGYFENISAMYVEPFTLIGV